MKKYQINNKLLFYYLIIYQKKIEEFIKIQNNFLFVFI